ncbi:MAG: hypothetical protein AMXMBFR84_10220 [Candidatus Hydrogenedentota bacterium]
MTRSAMVLGLVAWIAGSALADEMANPVYRFEPGMHLHYDSDTESKRESGETQYAMKITHDLWILNAVEGGGWKALYSEGRAFRSGESDYQNQDTNVIFITIRPTGQIEAVPMALLLCNPAAVIVPLPANESEAAGGWQQFNEIDQATTRYRRLEDSSGSTWKIEVTDLSPTNTVYEMTSSRVFDFDTGKGFVTGVESTSSMGYGSKSTSTTKVVLAEETMLEPDALNALVKEVATFEPALARIDELIEMASRQGDREDELLSEAESHIALLETDIQSEILKAQTEAKRKQFEGMKGYLKENAERIRAVKGKAAAAWEYPGLDGATHSLAEYKGKVLILDFWYRGCGWCIRAMPQLKALSEQYKDKPVAVIGINVDRNEEDAKFVAEKLELPYTNILTGPMGGEDSISKKYGVQGYPTLVIVDKKGKIHDMHVGYSPTLRADLSEIIDDLLAE